MTYDPTRRLPGTLAEAIVYASHFYRDSGFSAYLNGWAAREGAPFFDLLPEGLRRGTQSTIIRWAEAQTGVPTETPCQDGLFTAAESLNLRATHNGFDALALTVTSRQRPGMVTRYEATVDGERALLRAAAMAVALGATATVGLGDGLVGVLTVEALSCDCGKGIWCHAVSHRQR